MTLLIKMKSQVSSIVHLLPFLYSKSHRIWHLRHHLLLHRDQRRNHLRLATRHETAPRFIPALVSESPVSAAEDGRTCRALTGLHLLSAGTVDDVEKARSCGRRDTVIEMDHFVRGIATPKEVKKVKKAVGRDKRYTW
jgi:hypothetical protein